MINPINLREFADFGGVIECLPDGAAFKFPNCELYTILPWDKEDKAATIELGVIKALDLVRTPDGSPPPVCAKCYATTVEECNQSGCFFLESGNGAPAEPPPLKEYVKTEMIDVISTAIAEHNGLCMSRTAGKTQVSLAEYIYDAVFPTE